MAGMTDIAGQVEHRDGACRNRLFSSVDAWVSISGLFPLNEKRHAQIRRTDC